MERSTAQYSPILRCHGMLAGIVSGKQILELPVALTTGGGAAAALVVAV